METSFEWKHELLYESAELVPPQSKEEVLFTLWYHIVGLHSYTLNPTEKSFILS